MARTIVRIALISVAAAFAPVVVQADELEDWLSGEYATGDWGGLRTKLEDSGITFDGAYATDVLAVRNGNEGSGDGWAYAGRIDFGVTLDFEKLANIPGLSVYASGAWSSGSDLSDQQVGNDFTVQRIYSGREIRLAQLYVQQKLLDDRLSFKVGRLGTEDDFLGSEIYGNYVNGGINEVPMNVPENNFGFADAPFAQWGVVAAGEPVENLRLAVGVYNADEKTVDPRRNGTRFTLDAEDGVFAIGEASYAWYRSNKGEDEDEKDENVGAPLEAMPGLVKVGIFGESGDREDLKDDRDKDGSAGFYMSLEQMVYREPGTVDQGLTPWVVGAFLPRQSVNEMPVFAGTGLVYKGPLPRRDKDAAAIGFYYGMLSQDLTPSGSEKVLEIAYTAALTPWFYIRPDLQLVFDPAGVNSADTAVVFGGEIGITL